MFILDSPNKKLEVVLESAANSAELDITSSFIDIIHTKIAPWKMELNGSYDGNTNGATPVVLVDSPAENVRRQVIQYTVFNADNISANVVIRYNNNGIVRIISSSPLDPGKTLIYSSSINL